MGHVGKTSLYRRTKFHGKIKRFRMNIAKQKKIHRPADVNEIYHLRLHTRVQSHSLFTIPLIRWASYIILEFIQQLLA